MAYPHDSLLNLVTVFANEMYFFSDIFASEAWSQLKNLETAYLQELARTLPETVLQSKADSTAKCYNAGWQRWLKWSVENFGKTVTRQSYARCVVFTESTTEVFRTWGAPTELFCKKAVLQWVFWWENWSSFMCSWQDEIHLLGDFLSNFFVKWAFAAKIFSRT